ncbi:tetratricopeptide repeat protein [Aureimonas pseudogalii]|uniref:DUF560 domain-containing protein n=2 Tax=Aureimonas pseudogalii TaxID=1744844 RepID=A0A7W6MM37_9HYPH|nr:tetratricopeptide repeat protein [Aureimonas pseudogalii]MBB4000452.1 hypothetical protein [Aureimonas pseudogalii]
MPGIAAQRQALFAQMLADPSDLDAAFRYAALSAEAGDLEGAIATLERMLIFAPGLPRLQLELGVLYFRLGAYDTARTYLEGALSSPETPDEVRERVRPFLAAVEDRSSLQSLSGAVLLGGRYQSNANAAPESRTVNLNGIDFLLGDAAIRSADVNGFASGTLRYVHALPGQGDRFEVNLQSYGALYAERRELDTILGEVTAGPVFDLRRWRFEGTYLGVYAILGGVMLDADPYLVSGGVGTSLAKTFDPATQGLLRAEYRREEFRDSALRPTASSRTGDRYSLSGLLEHRLSDTLSVFAIGSGERRDADADFLSLWEGGATLGVTKTFVPSFAWTEAPWSATLSGGYAHRCYDDPDPIIDRVRSERDDEFFAQAALSVPVNDRWSIQSIVGYRDLSSNYDLRSFSNVSASLGVMRRF